MKSKTNKLNKLSLFFSFIYFFFFFSLGMLFDSTTSVCKGGNEMRSPCLASNMFPDL